VQESCEQRELITERHYLGIDPGTAGAFAVVSVRPDGTEELFLLPTPTVWVASGKGKRRRYALDAIHQLLGRLPPIALAYLEEQGARPGQGTVSTFSTGYGAGMWAAFLTAHGIPYTLVRPQRWRSAVGLPSHPKGAGKSVIKGDVCLAATRRFPDRRIPLDQADAVMLAVAARAS
jgi:crossover junction endodeoxyribonuclease RuvC